MALSIKNPKVERLAAELASITGETKTEAIRKALEERKNRLILQVIRRKRGESFLRFLEAEVWTKIPPGRLPTPEECDETLGAAAGGGGAR